MPVPDIARDADHLRAIRIDNATTGLILDEKQAIADARLQRAPRTATATPMIAMRFTMLDFVAIPETVDPRQRTDNGRALEQAPFTLDLYITLMCGPNTRRGHVFDEACAMQVAPD